MNPDAFFAAVDERRVIGSRYLELRYGMHVTPMTPEEAKVAVSAHQPRRHDDSGVCKHCGKPTKFFPGTARHADYCSRRCSQYAWSKRNREPEKPEFICADCGSGFMTRAAYMRHVEHLCPSIGELMCEKCGSRFRYPAGLEFHRKECKR